MTSTGMHVQDVRSAETARAPADLAAALGRCAEICRRNARNFHMGLSLVPEPRRSAVFALYAWMRAADDIADEPSHDAESARRRISEYRERTRAALAGRIDHAAPDAFIFLALEHVARAYAIDHAWLSDMLDGMDEDLAHSGYDSDAQLERYCHRVAGTVGMCCVTIWGVREGASGAKALELAARRGIAFQMTNILRDIAEDAGAQPMRCYIPRDAMARAGVSAADLARWSRPDACAQLVRARAAVAEKHYAASGGLESLLPVRPAAALAAMTATYRHILRTIAGNPELVVRTRVRCPTTRKLAYAATALARSAAGAFAEVAS